MKRRKKRKSHSQARASGISVSPCPHSQHCPGLALRPEERAAELIHWALPPHPGALKGRHKSFCLFLAKQALRLVVDLLTGVGSGGQ